VVGGSGTLLGCSKAPAQAGRSLDGGDDQNGYAIDGTSNFKAIYLNSELRSSFLLFLKNVFHLYPEDSFHQLIADITLTAKSDKEVYRQVQAQLPKVKPLLSEIRYAVPALLKQKKEMTRETLALLGGARKLNGYLELGSAGRYVSHLISEVEVKGDLVLVDLEPPDYSPVSILERGQLGQLGRYVPLGNYEPISTSDVQDESLDLVANFIGFHHSPPESRDSFVKSIHRIIRPGGRLILRDHDVHSTDMNRMVALAHDVFNLGIGTDWSVNHSEIRNFTAMIKLVPYLEGFGFKRSDKSLFQPGDPTLNTLMEFQRV
jgi:SAM-dependent methyltransferase